MHPTIEQAKAEALRKIRERRPRATWWGWFLVYVCARCGGSGDKGFSIWHSC